MRPARARGDGFTAELLTSDAVQRIAPFWEDLCTRVIEDNVYYTPGYARALLDNLPDAEVLLAVVWHQSRLVALLPVVVDASSLTPLAPSRAWKTLYTFNCTPLLDASLVEEAADALVGLLAETGGSEWHVPELNRDGKACKAITDALSRAEIPFDFCKEFARASLEQGPSFSQYLSEHMPARRRRDLLRNRRRLDGLGTVEHLICTEGQRLEHGVAAFLRLEAGGWKGTQGTALANAPKTNRFAWQAFGGDRSRVDLLTLNSEPIAASIALVAGRVGFTVKCAYDERYRSYSPGLLLELEVMRGFFEERWADRLDAATAGEHVIDGIWNGSTRVASLVVSFSAIQPALRVAALKRWYDLRRNVKIALRRTPAQGLLVSVQRRIGTLGVW